MVSLWMATQSYEKFLAYQGAAHPDVTMQEYNLPILRKFVQSSDLTEKYYLAKALAVRGLQLGGPGIMLNQEGVGVYMGRETHDRERLISQFSPEQREIVGPLIQLRDFVSSYPEKKLLTRAIQKCRI